MKHIKFFTLATLIATSALIFTSCEKEDNNSDLEANTDSLTETNLRASNATNSSKLFVGDILSFERRGFKFNGRLATGDLVVGAQVVDNEIFFVANYPKEVSIEEFDFETPNHLTASFTLIGISVNGVGLRSDFTIRSRRPRKGPTYRRDNNTQFRENPDGTVTAFTRLYNIKDANGEPITKINRFRSTIRFGTRQTPDFNPFGPRGAPILGTGFTNYDVVLD